jgi:hypothetical protein
MRRRSGMVRSDKIEVQFCAEHQTRNDEITSTCLIGVDASATIEQ